MPGHTQTQAEWEQAMARRAMELTRSELYLQMRYMNAALGALALTPDTDPARVLATNGAALVYSPAWVLRIYRQNRPYLLRGYLHSVLHCVFRHPWLRDRRSQALWGLACDIAVEDTLDHLDLPGLRRPVGWLRQQLYAEIRTRCRLPAAGPIFRLLEGRDTAELQKLQQEFYCDSHRLWPADPQSPAAQMMGRQWEQLGRQTQLSMQQAGRQAGETSGVQALTAQVEAARSRRTYRDFLRRFCVLREEPRLDPDTFDLNFYTYGLSVYGSLTYTRATYEGDIPSFKGRDLPLYSRQVATAGVRYEVDRWTYNLDAFAQSMQRAPGLSTDSQGNFTHNYITEPSADGQYGDIPGYVTWNARVGYDFGPQASNLKLGLGVKNLFDKQYFTRSSDNNSGIYVGQPRTLFMQASVGF